ncbi:MAG: histidine phosphatase family protein [Lentisphaerae bacterium]|nr:histidine phosphatase family protein [Lentisphaerota bacterium]
MDESMDEDSKRVNQTVMAIDDVERELRAGNRVLLAVRHAERPRIQNEDPSFGAALGLTDEGARTSREFGRLLRGAFAAAGGDVQFAASPLRRTVLTAALAAEGMGVPDASILEDEAVGNGCAYVADAHEIWELFRDTLFFEHMCEYMRDGVQRGFAPLAEATAAFEEYMMSIFRAKLGVFTTHDVYIAAFLHGRGVKTDFCKENWPRFLDAAAIVVEPSGHRRYALLRSGLSAGVCGVAPGEKPC